MVCMTCTDGNVFIELQKCNLSRFYLGECFMEKVIHAASLLALKDTADAVW